MIRANMWIGFALAEALALIGIVVRVARQKNLSCLGGGGRSFLFFRFVNLFANDCTRLTPTFQ